MPKKRLTSKRETKQPSIKLTWDLKQHFYTSEKDPQIEKDVKKAEQAYKKFAKKYKNKNFWSSAPKLLSALKDSEQLSKNPALRRPLYYYFFRIELNAKDSVAQKQATIIEERLTKAANQTIFFDLALARIPKKLQKQYLRDERLSAYHYDLKTTFDSAKHLLFEPEEKILSLKSDVSSGRWVAGTEKILNQRSITYKGKTFPLATAFDHITQIKNQDKPKFWNVITDELETLAPIAENELNAVVLNKKINDELRGYPEPYSATIKGYENDEAAVLNLVETITKEGFKLSRQYYSLKAKYAGKKKLAYVNRLDEVGKAPKIPFKKATSICRATFYDINPKYGEIFDALLSSGRTDVFPKQGKGGGAFCAHAVGMPTMVMLNHIDDVRSFTTLAHEMGHAVHSERSKLQPARYEDYSITTAETASTFFEGLAQDRLLETLSAKDQLYFLNFKIGEAVATICRQIAFFNFELDLHQTIRREGGMEWTEMADLFAKHMRAYMGPAIDVTRADGLSFIYVGHFRRFFYVYSYAYGELMSNSMAALFNENKNFSSQIDQFLTAGGSATVENIFAGIDFNTKQIDTFKAGLAPLRHDIAQFKKLIKATHKSS